MSDPVRVPLSKSGLFALVDAADAKVLLVKWRPSPNREGRHYAISSRFGMLHNYIAHPEPDMVVDHINGDGLDNRRCNLRVCSPSQNIQAQGPKSTNKTGFKGVYRLPSGLYRAAAKVGGVRTDLGRHHTPEGAARAYDQFVKVAVGPHAYINFPEAA